MSIQNNPPDGGDIWIEFRKKYVFGQTFECHGQANDCSTCERLDCAGTRFRDSAWQNYGYRLRSLPHAVQADADSEIDGLHCSSNSSEDNVGIGGGMVGEGESVDAILSGIVSESTSPDLAVGDQVAFTLRDNGEGQTSQPDQFTPPGRAKGPCAVGMIGGFLNNERGNIVIKPDEPAN